jgi:hypothetical protein
MKLPSTDFYLDVLFSQKRVQVPLDIKSIDIHSDIRAIAPILRFKMGDPTGLFSHRSILDDNGNTIQINISNDGVAVNSSFYNFDIYRRFPDSDQLYDISGILGLSNLFSKSYMRSFPNKKISEIIEQIGKEIGVDRVRISPGFDYVSPIIQPDWTNLELLEYLKTNIQTSTEDGGVFCYVVCEGKEKVLHFRTVRDLLTQPPKYKFMNSGNVAGDKENKQIIFPLLSYRMYDNEGVVYHSGVRKQSYYYFDYKQGAYKKKTIQLINNKQQIDNPPFLTPYFSVNKTDDPEVGESLSKNGRNTTSFGDYKGKAKNVYYKKLLDLNKILISVWGFDDIYPGDVVEVIFLNDIVNFPSYQYSGKWLVEQVDHSISNLFGTQLLLTRSGIHTDSKTTTYIKSEGE